MPDGLPTKNQTTIRCSMQSVQIGPLNRHLENSIVVGFNCQRLLPAKVTPLPAKNVSFGVPANGACLHSPAIRHFREIKMPVLYLTEADVDDLLTMPVAVDAMHQGFTQLAQQRAENVPRQRARAKGFVLHSMSATAEYLGLGGWKQYTTTSHGAKFLVGLYELATGELLTLIEANRLGQMRTGAVTGLAIQQLATTDARTAGILGSGWQAESQLEAACVVRPIERAVVFSPNPEHRMTFAAEMSRRLAIEVTAVDTPRQAVDEMPIVITATTSTAPVFEGSWIAPGALICAVGSNWLRKTEIDTTTISRAKHVVCDDVACCQHEAGDFREALDQGLFEWDQARALAEVVAAATPTRQDNSDIIVFKSVGMALEDVALGGQLLDRAQQERKGITLPF